MFTAQPAGAPEVCKKSLSEGPVTGGQDMFIIGKNFTKGTKVMFEERHGEQVIWSREAEIDQDYFQQVGDCLWHLSINQSVDIKLPSTWVLSYLQSHLICTVPEYKDTAIKCSVEVSMTIQSGGRISEPTCYLYKPGK